MSAETRGPVLFVDDEEHIRRAARQALELEDYEVRPLDAAEPALAALDAEWPGILVTDIRMPKMDGMQLMRRARELDPDLPVVLITGHGDIAMAVQAMREGAYDFIEKPFSSDHLVEVVGRAMDKRRLTLENRRLKREIEQQQGAGPRILGQSAPVARLRRMVDSLADAEADVLVFGETGTGKELVARTLHDRSGRHGGNFVAVNCGAVPETLMESEIFGHEAGAFTGAQTRRIGRVEHAQGGTLFLDEIESMPMNLQVKLLRVLQERQIERLGSNDSIRLDLRVVAATKVDLRAACDAGEFREDLYYRLNVVTVEVPPLRERREDIPLLFQHFVGEAAGRYNREAPPVDPEDIRALMAHDWPGNVRELQNAAERFVLFNDWRHAGAEDLVGAAGAETPISLPAQVEAFEKSLIAQELARHKGEVKACLDALGVPRKTFYDKLRKYGLDRRDYGGED